MKAEYYNNTLCIEGGWLYNEAAIMSKAAYDKLCQRSFNIVRRACKGTPALVAFDSIPERYRAVLIAKYGNPADKVKHNILMKELTIDNAAFAYYSSYQLHDGRNLPDENVIEYTNNASILNAVHNITSDQRAIRRALGGNQKGMWNTMAALVQEVVAEYPHTLPTNALRLQEKLRVYLAEGYRSLIHRGFGNSNSKKVNEQLEQLILALYCMKEKPYVNVVRDMYMQFLGGALDVVNTATGELFNRADFVGRDGNYILISEATVWNYINDPKNRNIVDTRRMGKMEYNGTHRPHHHRHAPNFALSKISLDDRDLPRKMTDGNRVKAYYAYDVLSGCVVGASYSKVKDTVLFIDCMRSLFVFLDKHGLGLPLELEVEHHLVNQFKNDLMKAGVVFPFIRWCVPGNSQEKYAEVLNKVKKYGFEKRYQQGIGRFYAKLEANRTTSEKVFDEKNNTYKEHVYSYDELVADDLSVINLYNNSLHPDQKRFAGLTRLEVLKQYANPNLANIERSLVVRYIGNHTRTSVLRSQYVKVQHEKYALPTPQVIERLGVNDYNVDAYYLPQPDGTIRDVYLYQNNEFVCKCEKMKAYNTATAERTGEDVQIYKQQAEYVKSFDTMTKERKVKVAKVKVIENKQDYSLIPIETHQAAIEMPFNKPENEFEMLFSEANEEYDKLKALNDL